MGDLLYYLFSTLAAIAGPMVAGTMIQNTGNNYSTLFLMAPACMAVAILCMLGVKKGEAKTGS